MRNCTPPTRTRPEGGELNTRFPRAPRGWLAGPVRYYETLGLVAPTRLGNGYRDYDDLQVRVVCYPVFPPDKHAQEVLDWLDGHP